MDAQNSVLDRSFLSIVCQKMPSGMTLYFIRNGQNGIFGHTPGALQRDFQKEAVLACQNNCPEWNWQAGKPASRESKFVVPALGNKGLCRSAHDPNNTNPTHHPGTTHHWLSIRHLPAVLSDLLPSVSGSYVSFKGISTPDFFPNFRQA